MSIRLQTVALLFIIGVAVISVGQLTYRYVKEKPPTFLIEQLTKTNAPAPLPAGEKAPLIAPEGFTATIFARNITGARVMTRDAKGTMLVSQTAEGKVVALPDMDSDGVSDRTVVVLENLKQPHGILVYCPSEGGESASKATCVLYVAETGELKSYAYDADTLTARYNETLTTFPTGAGHYTRTLLLYPDGKRLLISVGSSCNVCEEEDARRATILALELTTNKITTIATGLRNTVFMAVDPVAGSIWGTDNGRDIIGDDIPPDEVNIIEEGKKYGWPICYGENVHDTDFDNKQYIRDPCADMTPPHIPLQAHSAPLGLTFIPEEGWPEEMRGDLLVAYHGSWNRSVSTGYKVVRFDLNEEREASSTAPSDFLTGFLEPGGKPDNAIGRPVGLLAEPGGVVYVSDDRAGAIYRLNRMSIE